MAGRTPNDAVKAFVAPIQAALGCFADGRVSADQREPGDEGVLTFNKAETVRLFGSKPTFVSVSMRYEIVETDDSRKGPWKVSTRGWVYTISDEAQALAEYHWHPVSASHVTTPHVHLGGKAHYPTGRVLIEEVLDFAVDHGAEPRDPARWSALRDDNRAKFLRGATWGAGPT